MSPDVTSFVDVAQGLGEPRTLVSILSHDVFCTFMCVSGVFSFCLLMFLCMHLSVDNNGEIGDDNGEMVKYGMC